MLTLELTSNNMLSSLPAAAATAVAQRSQGGKQAKSIPLVKCTQKKRPSRNACAAVQNSTSVHSVCTAVELKPTRSNAQHDSCHEEESYNTPRPVNYIHASICSIAALDGAPPLALLEVCRGRRYPARPVLAKLCDPANLLW